MRVRFAILPMLVLAAACASAGAGGGGNPNQLTATDLADASNEVLYETIQRVRPQWLQTRSGQPDPLVLIDGIESGTPSTLRTLTSGRVEVIRYIRPETAVSRFGAGRQYEGGVIEVLLKR
jgi:hypothetical protein